MSNQKKDIAGLVQLTGLHYRSAQSAMAALLQQEARLRQNLADLNESRHQYAAQQRPLSDPAMKAGADLRWHKWVDQRRAVINGELAQVLSAKEKCRRKLQRAFGRDQAGQALRDRAEMLQLQTQRRRSDYES